MAVRRSGGLLVGGGRGVGLGGCVSVGGRRGGKDRGRSVGLPLWFARLSLRPSVCLFVGVFACSVRPSVCLSVRVCVLYTCVRMPPVQMLSYWIVCDWC